MLRLAAPLWLGIAVTLTVVLPIGGAALAQPEGEIAGAAARVAPEFRDRFFDGVIDPGWQAIESTFTEEAGVCLSGLGVLVRSEPLAGNVELRLTLGAGVTGTRRGLVLAMAGTSLADLSGYTATWDDAAARLSRWDNGVETVLAAAEGGGSRDIVLRRSGDEVHADICGNPLAAPDSVYGRGLAGIIAFDAATFVDFQMSSSATATGPIVGLATFMCGGEAADSSRDGHYTELTPVPGYPGLQAARFNCAAELMQWLEFRDLNNGFENWDLPAFSSTFRFVPATLPGGGEPEPGDVIWVARDAVGNRKLSIYFRHPGTLELMGLNETPHPATRSPALTAGRLHWVQVTGESGPAATCTLRILDENLTELFSTAATMGTGWNNYARARIGKCTTLNDTVMDLYYPGIAFGSGARIEAGFTTRVKKIAGNGPVVEWTPVPPTAAPWSVLTDLPHNNATYVRSSEDNAVAEFGLQSSAAVGVTGSRGILAVRYLALINSPGGHGRVRCRLTSGGVTVENESELMVPAGDEAFGLTLDTDPATGGPWSAAALDTMTVGVRNCASAQSRLVDAYLMILSYE